MTLKVVITQEDETEQKTVLSVFGSYATEESFEVFARSNTGDALSEMEILLHVANILKEMSQLIWIDRPGLTTFFEQAHGILAGEIHDIIGDPLNEQ